MTSTSLRWKALTLSDFDLDHSKDEDIPNGTAPESKPVDTAVYTKVPHAQALWHEHTQPPVHSCVAEMLQKAWGDTAAARSPASTISIQSFPISGSFIRKSYASPAVMPFSQKMKAIWNQNQPFRKG